MSRASLHYNNYVFLKLFKKNIMHICKKIEVRPLLTIVFCLWYLSTQAQSTRKYSNAFMDISVAVIFAFLYSLAKDKPIAPEPVPKSSILKFLFLSG